MRIVFLTLAFLFFQLTVSAQDLCEKVKTDKSLKAEGVKIVETDSGSFLVSVASVAKGSKTTSAMNRVATVKCRRGVLTYIQGSVISSETIITTSEKVTGRGADFYESFFEQIKESSAGFVQGMESLCTWESADHRTYYKAIYSKIDP